MSKTIEEIETDKAEDLLTWEEENDALLPLDIDKIIELEAQGFVVDLTTGKIFKDPDAVQP